MQWLASILSSILTLVSIALLYFCSAPTNAQNITNNILMLTNNKHLTQNPTREHKKHCVNIPPAGIAYAVPNIRTHKLTSVSVTNLQPDTMQLILSPVNRHGPEITLIMPPNSRKNVSIPINEYAMSGQIGQTWCSPYAGFSSNSLDFYMNDTLHTSAYDTAKLTFSHINHAISLNEIHTPNGRYALQGKKIVLHKGSDGHFHITGLINGKPVVFMIDTGASNVSIPLAIANSANINTSLCHTSTHSTANGETIGCDTYADNIHFAQFSAQHFPISVLPRLNTALLGMSALKAFRINIDGDSLALSPKH